MQVVCARGSIGGCGFRAHDRYFETKMRFQPGICPSCSGPIAVVEDATDTRVLTHVIDRETGRLVAVS